MSAGNRQRPAAGNLVLDHIAHFVPDLAQAADLLGRLGFFPTPLSHHMANGKPAGTSNRCVMLEEGYLEILSPTSDTPHAGRVRERMKRYDGVHLVCYGSAAAPEEHARLAAHGFEPEPLVDLRRKLASGEEVAFRVVYVPPAKMPECRAQYCEHLTPETVWKDEFLAHDNGVIGLGSAYLVADDPVAVAARWAEFSGLIPSRDGDFTRLDTSRGRVYIGSRNGLSKIFQDVPAAPGVAGIGLRFRDPAGFLQRCRSAGLKVAGSAVSLPPALGGAWIIEGP